MEMFYSRTVLELLTLSREKLEEREKLGEREGELEWYILTVNVLPSDRKYKLYIICVTLDCMKLITMFWGKGHHV